MPGEDALKKYNEPPTIEVGPVETLAQESEENYVNPYDNNNKKKAEIIITKKEYGRMGSKKLDVVTSKKNVTDNEIQKTDGILGMKAFKSMNLTMKKELLKRGKH